MRPRQQPVMTFWDKYEREEATGEIVCQDGTPA